MKLFKRVGAVILLVAAVTVWAGSAWADAEDVAQAIRDCGLDAAVSGTTITVTGSNLSLPINQLDLGDISGLTIDWQASVTGIADGNRGDMIRVGGNGTVKITGGTITLPSATERWITAFDCRNDADVVNYEVSGGTIQGYRPEDVAIDAGSGTITITGGLIDVPRGNALFAKNLTVGPGATINGLAYSEEDYTFTAYGNVTTVTQSDVFEDQDEPISVSSVVREGTIWNIEGVQSDMTAFSNEFDLNMAIESGGTVNLNGTSLKFNGGLTVDPGAELNLDRDSVLRVNDLVIRGAGSRAAGGVHAMADPNNGVVNNSGVIEVPAGGKITNEGTIANEGTIDNEGTIVNDGTIKSDTAIDGVTGNPVQPLGDNNPPSSGGGCNAGLGLFGLLLAGLVGFKYKRA